MNVIIFTIYMSDSAPNIEVVLDMLNHNDANLSYFAATRLKFIFGLLEIAQERETMDRLIDKLLEMRNSGRL